MRQQGTALARYTQRQSDRPRAIAASVLGLSLGPSVVAHRLSTPPPSRTLFRRGRSEACARRRPAPQRCIHGFSHDIMAHDAASRAARTSCTQ